MIDINSDALKLSENARRNELRLQLALEAAGMFCFEWEIPRDSVHRVDSANPHAAQQAAAFDNFEAVCEAVHPDDRERFRANVHAALEREDGRYENEIRVIRGDGQTAWFLEKGRVERDASGRPMRLIGMAQDITGRKRIEEALRARARQQRAVAALGELALKERDLCAVFDHATAAIAETLEVEYSKVLELLPGGDTLALRAGCAWKQGLVGAATVSTGLNSQAGYTLLSDKPVIVADLKTDTRFNGPPLLVEHGVVSGMSCIIRRTDGTPWGVLGAHSTRRLDFTDDDVSFLVAVANILGNAIHREYAEQELRISEARFRSLFNSRLIGVITWNLDGAITDANDTFLEMLGYGRDDLDAGRLNWRHITPREFQGIDRIAAENLRLRGSTPPFEKEYFRKDGSRLPILLAAATLDETHHDGVGLVLDISERKRDEARFQKLHTERFNSMRIMAAGLAHEINQPLAATATYLRTVRRLLDIEPEQRKFGVPETLDKAFVQVTRAGKIIAHLRDFIAHGEPNKLMVHLHDIIHDACQMAIPDAELRAMNITLRLRASDDKALADPVQIRQVLTNLIRNASEAMIGAVQRELTVSTSSTHSEVRVDIADTGMGLSEEVRLRLFQPFTTTKADGMGIGLAISRTIVEAHHGEISFRANPEGGAVFSCTLPLATWLAES